MKRKEVEDLIVKTVQKLQQTHSGLLVNIDIEKFKRHGLTIAFHESKFDEKAKSKSSTAKGLFQILDGTRRDIEKRLMKLDDKSPYEKIWDIDYNAYLGLGYFASQLQRYKLNWEQAIIAYNLGRWKGEKTTIYLKKHNEYYEELFGSNTGEPAFRNEIVFKFGFK